VNQIDLPPFGVGFEVSSALSPDALKRAIRSRKKKLFDTRSGPRGLALGPLICLWLSPYWTMGPNAVGLISRRRSASRIIGLAGFDLGGTAMLIVIALVGPLAIGLSGKAGFGFSMLALVLFPIGGWLILWSRAGLHHDADPFLRFLDTVSRPVSRPRRAKSSAVRVQRHMILTVDGEERSGLASWEEIETALNGLESDSFLILSESPETYVQLLRAYDEFAIEKRDGDRHNHFQATRRDAHAGRSSATGPTFSAPEALAILAAHASNAPAPTFIAWEKMRM